MHLLLSFLLTASAGSRALLIAVESGSDDSERIGAAADVAALSAVLLQRGMDRGDVVVLSDAEATVSGILGAMDAHLGAAEAGDHLLLHYSGHGVQLPDDSGDEPDGYDEALSAWDGALRDDRLGAALSALRAVVGPTGSVAVTLDACHSATATRGELPLRILPPAGPPARVPVGAVRLDRLTAESEGAAPLVVLSAARAGQAARSIYADGGAVMGAFSAALVAALSRPTESWMSVYDQVFAELARTARGQHPVIEGSAHLQPLGVLSGAPGGVLVTGQLGDGRLLLAAGTLSGLAPGARVAIYAPGTPSTLLVTGTIDAVTGTAAWLVPDSSAPATSTGGRAFVIAPASTPAPLQVRLDLGDDDLARSWWVALAADPLIEVVGQGGQLVLAERDGSLQLLDPSTPSPLAVAPTAPPSESLLWESLQQRARSAVILRTSMSSERYRVEVALTRADPQTCAVTGAHPTDGAGQLVVTRGQTVRLQVTHRGASAAWLVVVHIDEAGRATQLFPASGQASEQLAPGRAWDAPACWTAA
ncbi:MAG: hypothetical protein ACI8S6_003588, partial [Myxococcota bacterium]